MTKVLNCLCKQCRLCRSRNKLYKLQRRKARRELRRMLDYAVSRRSHDIDIPVKYKGQVSS